MPKPKSIKILLELRPALEGFAGIPQETRLLFRGLRSLPSIQIEGLLQTSHRHLALGTVEHTLFRRQLSPARRTNRYSRVVVSMAEPPFRSLLDKVLDYLSKRLATGRLLVSTLAGFGGVQLTAFASSSFEDFTWRTLFARTLPASDFALVATADHRVCSIPWHTMHLVGLLSLNFAFAPKYPRLDTRDFDVFIGQTPYPARISPKTRLVIRYHDALPVFMPHTIPDKSIHQATHFYSLLNNMTSGAWFACVSNATRNDLLKLFPDAGDRIVTIHNMVSHHYFPEESSIERVPGIIRARLHEGDLAKGVDLSPRFFTLREKETFYRRVLGDPRFRYLLVVSTIEPRKNHLRLLAAWEILKTNLDPSVKLVVVGGLGWDYGTTIRSFMPWIERGELFVLSSVPAPDLRVLYRHAAATVCPSLGEGFDFSGIEGMRSGTAAVVASDIPVHREVYGPAAAYFDPYSTGSLVNTLSSVLYGADAHRIQLQLQQDGTEVSSRYLPEKILPQWDAFLARVLKE